MKSGFVSIIGLPNVGKSTLLNKILGEKIAAVSSKPQTTRTKIMGVYTEEHGQIVFLDTPGMHKSRNKLGDIMNRTVDDARADSDIVYYLVDHNAFATLYCGSHPESRGMSSDGVGFIPTSSQYQLKPKFADQKMFLLINKVDEIPKENVLPIIDKMQDLYEFTEIVPISARTGDGVDRLIQLTFEHLPKGPLYYPDDTLTDQPERGIVAEMIREKVFRMTNDEVPFGVAVEVDKMRDDGDLVYISANVYCEKSSHKGIIIGKDGEMLRRIGAVARTDIERMLGVKVYLDLWVKVQKDWRDSLSKLKNLGYI